MKFKPLKGQFGSGTIWYLARNISILDSKWGGHARNE